MSSWSINRLGSARYSLLVGRATASTSFLCQVLGVIRLTWSGILNGLMVGGFSFLGDNLGEDVKMDHVCVVVEKLTMSTMLLEN